MAGGYDPFNVENIRYLIELVSLVHVMNLDDRVIFLKSPSDATKITLIRQCLCLIYTPSNEHFGIVPLEAMYCSKPVVAVNNGGPKETINNGFNGYLCDAKPEEFANAVKQFVENEEKAERFGKNGKQRFDDVFSFEAFKTKVNCVIDNLYKSE